MLFSISILNVYAWEWKLNWMNEWMNRLESWFSRGAIWSTLSPHAAELSQRTSQCITVFFPIFNFLICTFSEISTPNFRKLLPLKLLAWSSMFSTVSMKISNFAGRFSSSFQFDDSKAGSFLKPYKNFKLNWSALSYNILYFERSFNFMQQRIGVWAWTFVSLVSCGLQQL